MKVYTLSIVVWGQQRKEPWGTIKLLDGLSSLGKLSLLIDQTRLRRNSRAYVNPRDHASSVALTSNKAISYAEQALPSLLITHTVHVWQFPNWSPRSNSSVLPVIFFLTSLDVKSKTTFGKKYSKHVSEKLWTMRVRYPGQSSAPLQQKSLPGPSSLSWEHPFCF